MAHRDLDFLRHINTLTYLLTYLLLREGRGGKEKEGRGWGEEGDGREGKGGEGKGGERERMWRGPESGLPRGPCWLSAGLLVVPSIVLPCQLNQMLT